MPQGLAVQTMRSATHVQPGQTLSCIGCHESRHKHRRPPRPPLASLREPSRLTAGPEGSWPLRFDRLVQPVLDRQCVSCHNPKRPRTPSPRSIDLTPDQAYDTLTRYGKPSLLDQVCAPTAKEFQPRGRIPRKPAPCSPC